MGERNVTILLTCLTCMVIGFCIGVLAQDAYDLLFHVEQWLRAKLP
jgi:hypothetical protein